MTDIAEKYKIPAEVMAFVHDGFLEVVSGDEAKKTVEFHIPSRPGRRTTEGSRAGRSSGFTPTSTPSSANTTERSPATCRISMSRRTRPTLAAIWSMGWIR